MNTTFVSFALALFTMASPALAAPLAVEPASPRERISINHGWRFQKEDPPGTTTNLSYDVRPELKNERDDKAADAQPIDANGAATPAPNVLKPWVLPTGNAFVKNPARRAIRPAGHPGSDVPYVQG